MNLRALRRYRAGALVRAGLWERLAAFEDGFADRLLTHPDLAVFRRQVLEAAPTWPERALPPKATLLWFRDGAWHPGPA